MTFDISSLFDEFADKTVSHNDKEKHAYVLSVAQVKVLVGAHAPFHNGGSTGAPPLNFYVLGNAGTGTVAASLYGSIRGESGRPIEARMGRDFITKWLQTGDTVRIGRIGDQTFVLKVGEPVDIEQAARTFAKTVLPARLKSMAEARPEIPPRVSVTTTRYVRDAIIVAAALQRAANLCERPACSQELFSRDDGTIYLEVHHVIPLSEDGLDVIANVAALCPSCHRETHYGAKRAALRQQLLIKIAQAVTPGLVP